VTVETARIKVVSPRKIRLGVSSKTRAPAVIPAGVAVPLGPHACGPSTSRSVAGPRRTNGVVRLRCEEPGVRCVILGAAVAVYCHYRTNAYVELQHVSPVHRTVIVKVDRGLDAAARGNDEVPHVEADMCVEARVSLLVGG
jgi:hypothetical protein